MQFLKSDNRNRIFTMIAAFAAIYFFWGSTYLAIRYAIETMPSFLMASGRFLIAGSILFLFSMMQKGFERPKAEHWRSSFIVGSLLLLGGNGGVVFAEKYIDSSLAALLVASEPFWVVLLSWLWLGHGRPEKLTITGLIVGFIGVALLLSGGGKDLGETADGSLRLIASFAVLFAALSWATGSIYGLKAKFPKSPFETAGMQMMAGGVVLFLASLLTGEINRFDLQEVSTKSWLGFAYLTVFGSLVGFTAYSWLLKNARPSLVATYAYINPAIAVFLGWLIGGEKLSAQMLIGAAIIVGSVVLISGPKKKETKSSKAEVEAEAENANNVFQESVGKQQAECTLKSEAAA
jgi:drug/metabolite transporter (DMT)-like permease